MPGVFLNGKEYIDPRNGLTPSADIGEGAGGSACVVLMAILYLHSPLVQVPPVASQRVSRLSSTVSADRIGLTNRVIANSNAVICFIGNFLMKLKSQSGTSSVLARNEAEIPG